MPMTMSFERLLQPSFNLLDRCLWCKVSNETVNDINTTARFLRDREFPDTLSVAFHKRGIHDKNVGAVRTTALAAQYCAHAKGKVLILAR